MARARLLLRRSDDPDVVAELARDRFQEPQPPRVHAVVVGQQDPHAEPMREALQCCNREPLARKLRHIRNSLAICSLLSCQCLLTVSGLTIAPGWGRRAFDRVSPGKVSLNLPPAAPVARPQPGGGVWDVHAELARASAGRE